MEKYAQIPKIQKGVVFSDPLYDETVWCQYRKDFSANRWLMKLETTPEDGYLSFTLSLGRPTVLSGVEVVPDNEGIRLKFPERFSLQDKELGMDSAQIFCGLKEHWDGFAQEASIHTGTDGFFGNLMVFTCKGENVPAGFLLFGDIDELFMDENSLFQHFLSSFDAKEISPELFASKTDKNSLGMKLLVGSELRNANEQKAPDHSNPEKETER